MIDYINNLPWKWGVLALWLLTASLAIAGLLVIRHFVKKSSLRGDHDIAGFTFGIIGVMYAVLLTFIVINVHDRFNSVQKNLDKEANIVVNLFRDSYVFPVDLRENIRTHLKEYAEAIASEAWINTETGEIHMQLDGKIHELWNLYYSYNPKDGKENIWYAESIKNLNLLNETRLERLFNSEDSINPMMWSLLIIGALITITFMYFFEPNNLTSHVIMTGVLSGFIAFMLYYIHSMDTVFSGDIRISGAHFQEIIPFLNEWST